MFTARKFAVALCLSVLASSKVVALEVNVSDSLGGEYTLEFDANEPFSSVLEAINQCFSDSDARGKGFWLEGVVENRAGFESVQLFAKSAPRDYYSLLSTQDKKDLTYILRTLANNSLIKIAKEKSNLKKAGDRIDHLHPFKFLEAIFTDEELKVCLRNIEGKSWVWSEFLDGLVSSLNKESNVNNLKDEYIESLASAIKIDVNLIQGTIKNKEWSRLVTDLIALVPRSGDSNRYHM